MRKTAEEDKQDVVPVEALRPARTGCEAEKLHPDFIEAGIRRSGDGIGVTQALKGLTVGFDRVLIASDEWIGKRRMDRQVAKTITWSSSCAKLHRRRRKGGCGGHSLQVDFNGGENQRL